MKIVIKKIWNDKKTLIIEKIGSLVVIGVAACFNLYIQNLGIKNYISSGFILFPLVILIIFMILYFRKQLNKLPLVICGVIIVVLVIILSTISFQYHIKNGELNTKYGEEADSLKRSINILKNENLKFEKDIDTLKTIIDTTGWYNNKLCMLDSLQSYKNLNNVLRPRFSLKRIGIIFTEFFPKPNDLKNWTKVCNINNQFRQKFEESKGQLELHQYIQTIITSDIINDRYQAFDLAQYYNAYMVIWGVGKHIEDNVFEIELFCRIARNYLFLKTNAPFTDRKDINLTTFSIESEYKNLQYTLDEWTKLIYDIIHVENHIEGSNFEDAIETIKTLIDKYGEERFKNTVYLQMARLYIECYRNLDGKSKISTVEESYKEDSINEAEILINKYLSSEDKKENKALAYYYKGYLYETVGRVNSAISNYRMAFETEMSDFEYLSRYVQMLMGQNRKKVAYDATNECIKSIQIEIRKLEKKIDHTGKYSVKARELKSKKYQLKKAENLKKDLEGLNND